MIVKDFFVIEQKQHDKNVDSFFIEYISKLVHKYNQNFMAIFTGSTGSGKSWSELSMEKRIDPAFNSERVVYTGQEFAKFCLPKYRLPKGSAIVWDEVGVNLSSREFFSKGNRKLNYILETFRINNYVVFFTTPSLSFLDSIARKLIHCIVETKYINRNKNTVRVSFRGLKADPITGELVPRYFRKYTDNKIRRVGFLDIEKPPEILVEEYERRKRVFTDDVSLKAYEVFSEEFADVFKATGQEQLTEKEQLDKIEFDKAKEDLEKSKFRILSEKDLVYARQRGWM